MTRAIVLQHTPTEGPERRRRRCSAARGIRCETRCPLRGRAGARRRRRRPAADRHGRTDGRRRRGRRRSIRSSPPSSRCCASWSRATRPCSASASARSCSPPAAGARVYPNTRPGPDGSAGAGARGRLGPGRLRSAPTASRRWPACAAARAGAALARRHVRPAARRGAPGVDAGLPAPGVPARAGGSSACSSTRELERETIAVWVREDADYVRDALGPDGGARILADTDRHYADRAPDLGSAARQHHLGHAIVGAPWPSHSSFKIGLVQMRCSADPDGQPRRARVARIATRPTAARRSSACPSCSARQYFCQSEDHAHFDLAEPIPGPTTEALAQIAREARRGRSSRRCSSGARPASTTTRRWSSTPTARCSGIYRKMHIPDDPLYYEKFYFTPGDLGFRAFDTAFGRIGTLVCWDQWYPEAARLTALAGADVLFYPTAIGWHPSEKAEYGAAPGDGLADHRSARTRSPTASTSRPSTASATSGRSAATASSSGAAASSPIRSASCSPRPSRDRGGDAGRRPATAAHQETVRRHWPFLRDRRIDAYGADHPPLPRRMKRARAGRDPAEGADRRLPRSASACPPSGSRTRRPGSPGRTSARDWPGKLARHPLGLRRDRAPPGRGERVRILVGDGRGREARARRCSRRVGVDAGRGRLLPRRRPTAAGRATTARSSSPTAPARSRSTNWRFNGWAKYAEPQARRRRQRSHRPPRLGMRQWQPTRARSAGKPARVVLEGGTIDVNGARHAAGDRGVPARRRAGAQPGPARARRWRRCWPTHLGVRKVLWLGRGIAGDDTHGHVDDLARFVDATTVVIAHESDPRDANYEPLRENRERLERMTTADGRPLRVVDAADARAALLRRHAPAGELRELLHRQRGRPRADLQRPDRPRARWRSWPTLFPTRRVVGIHAVDLVWGLGTLHCMTQQEARRSRSARRRGCDYLQVAALALARERRRTRACGEARRCACAAPQLDADDDRRDHDRDQDAVFGAAGVSR